MQRIIQHCGSKVEQEILRFPKLHEKIIEVVTQMLKRRLPPTISMVENLVNIELAYVNTKHPDFGGHEMFSMLGKNTLLLEAAKAAERHPKHPQQQSQQTTAMKTVSAHVIDYNIDDNNDAGLNSFDKKIKQMTGASNQSLTRSSVQQKAVSSYWSSFFNKGLDGDSLPNGAVDTLSIAGDSHGFNLAGLYGGDDLASDFQKKAITSRESHELLLIKNIISKYFLIIRKNIKDSVPKAIMHFLVNHVKENLQSELVSHLYQHEKLEGLLEESDHITEKRKEAAEKLKALQRASEIISEIRETRIS